jgi:hypothetical protein
MQSALGQGLPANLARRPCGMLQIRNQRLTKKRPQVAHRLGWPRPILARFGYCLVVRASIQ